MANIITFNQKQPDIDKRSYINPYAIVIGDVTIHEGVSVWPGAIIRAYEDTIEIAANTALLDRSFIEASRGKPVRIGRNVLVSHGAKLQGCSVHDSVLIGINVSILDGAVIEEGSVIGPNTIITPNTEIPPRSKVNGIPGKVRGQVTDKELEEIWEKHAEIVRKAHEYGKWFATKQV